LHHPRHSRGDFPRRPGRGDDGGALDDQTDRRRRAAAPPRPWQRGVRRAVPAGPRDPVRGGAPRAPRRGQPAVSQERGQRRLRFLGYAASVAIVLTLWQFLSSRAIIPLLFPSPISTWRVGLGLAAKGQLGADVGASLGRILAGFAIGSALGV